MIFLTINESIFDTYNEIFRVESVNGLNSDVRKQLVICFESERFFHICILNGLCLCNFEISFHLCFILGQGSSDCTIRLVDNDRSTNISLIDLRLHINNDVLLSLQGCDLFLDSHICDLKDILVSLR